MFSFYELNFVRLIPDKPKSTPDLNKPIEDGRQFRIVCTSKVGGKFRCLFGAGVDGVESDSLVTFDNLSEAKFVKVKSKLAFKKFDKVEKFRKSTLPFWWAQSAVMGHQKIYCGWRNFDFHLERIEIMKVEDLPKICKQYWSPGVMIRTCNEILEMINTKMEDIDCPKTVYEFSYKNKTFTYEKFEGPNQYSFLPDDYIQHLNDCN